MKQLSRTGFTLVGSLLLTNVSAIADPVTDDLRCAMVYMQMGTSKEPAIQAAGSLGMLYFLGKLDGRTPDLDVENRVIAELPNLKGDYFRAEAVRCGSELQKRGREVTAMGKDMMQR